MGYVMGDGIPMPIADSNCGMWGRWVRGNAQQDCLLRPCHTNISFSFFCNKINK